MNRSPRAQKIQIRKCSRLLKRQYSGSHKHELEAITIKETHQGRMGFTNRVDVRGRQKVLEAPRGSPQSSSRAQQDGEGDGGRRRRWRHDMAKHSRCAREGARAETGASEGEVSWRGWALRRGHMIYSEGLIAVSLFPFLLGATGRECKTEVTGGLMIQILSFCVGARRRGAGRGSLPCMLVPLMLLGVHAC